jgi:hypothetical protein
MKANFGSVELKVRGLNTPFSGFSTTKRVLGVTYPFGTT